VLDHNSGSLLSTYLTGTPEEISIAMDWAPGLNIQPNIDDCKRYLHEVLDNCDTNTPRNVKGGGTFQVGDVGYRLQPIAVRGPAPDAPFGKCFSGDEGYSWAVVGAGWLNSDSGGALWDALSEDEKLKPRDWVEGFKYRFDSADGSDWRVDFKLPPYPYPDIDEKLSEVISKVAGVEIACEN
jgi:hypothetical protein